MSYTKTSAPLPPDARAELLSLVARDGLSATARALDLTVRTVERALDGKPLQRRVHALVLAGLPTVAPRGLRAAQATLAAAERAVIEAREALKDFEASDRATG